MKSNKKINPAAINALKEALANIYWYKKQLRSFLINTLVDSSILVNINWDDYKWHIADRLVDTLVNDEERYQGELIRLFSSVSSIEDFSHLEYLDDGKEKIKKAKLAVDALKKYTSIYQMVSDGKKKSEERRTAYLENIAKVNSFKNRLINLNNKFTQLVISTDFQKRGYLLEELLKELFELFDLDPKASFKIIGEQIDGGFSFEGFDYLFEAKWHNEYVHADALDSLASKVARKLDNTLGLFLAINGFSSDGVTAHSTGRKVVLLMDGSDLAAVLEGRIELPDLLRRKKRHASNTGDIYLKYKDMV